MRLVRGVVIDYSGLEEGYGLFWFRFGEGHNLSGVCFNSEFWKDVRDRRAYKFMLVVTSHYCSLVSAVIITSVSFRHSPTYFVSHDQRRICFQKSMFFC